MTSELEYNKAKEIRSQIAIQEDHINRFKIYIKDIRKEIKKLKNDLEPLKEGEAYWMRKMNLKSFKLKGFVSAEKEREIMEGK